MKNRNSIRIICIVLAVLFVLSLIVVPIVYWLA